jgi:hypothetical protein
LIIVFYLTVNIATSFNSNNNSFVNLDDFNSDDEGANVREPDHNNNNPIIPLSNIPLKTIFKEDKEDKPEFGPKPKKIRRGTEILTIK